MANNDLRGRRIVDSKPVVRAPLDEYGFPHGAGNASVSYFHNFLQELRNMEVFLIFYTSYVLIVLIHKIQFR